MIKLYIYTRWSVPTYLDIPIPIWGSSQNIAFRHGMFITFNWRLKWPGDWVWDDLIQHKQKLSFLGGTALRVNKQTNSAGLSSNTNKDIRVIPNPSITSCPPSSGQESYSILYTHRMQAPESLEGLEQRGHIFVHLCSFVFPWGWGGQLKWFAQTFFDPKLTRISHLLIFVSWFPSSA